MILPLAFQSSPLACLATLQTLFTHAHNREYFSYDERGFYKLMFFFYFNNLLGTDSDFFLNYSWNLVTLVIYTAQCVQLCDCNITFGHWFRQDMKSEHCFYSVICFYVWFQEQSLNISFYISVGSDITSLLAAFYLYSFWNFLLNGDLARNVFKQKTMLCLMLLTKIIIWQWVKKIFYTNKNLAALSRYKLFQ